MAHPYAWPILARICILATSKYKGLYTICLNAPRNRILPVALPLNANMKQHTALLTICIAGSSGKAALNLPKGQARSNKSLNGCHDLLASRVTL